jgi:hypothetical protein
MTEFPERFGRSLYFLTEERVHISMSVDRSRERRQRVCECLAMAKQASDANIRGLLVEMAWKWFDLAELDEWNNWEKAWRVCAIRTKIGRELRGQFELPQEMPPPILALLAEIDATTTNGQSRAT